MRQLLVFLVMGMALTACGGESERGPGGEGDPMARTSDAGRELPEAFAANERLTRFPGRLADAADAPELIDRPPLAAVRKLDEAAISRLLDRLEPLPGQPEDTRDFAVRADSQPPPRAGPTVLGVFPLDAELEPPSVALPEGPLAVLRWAPEAEVAIAGQISLTFDRPMVAVTAHDELAQQVPVRLTPALDGRWRWVGTRTLLFEPEAARLPMASTFEVRVEPGVRAADGSILETAHEWRFSTPPVRLVDAYPTGSAVVLEPVMLLVFDQRVRLDDLRPHLKLRDHLGEDIAWRAATDEELGADIDAARMAAALEPGRWVAIRPESALPSSSTIEMVLDAGAASAEGERLTTEPQRRQFSTYGPFIVQRQQCGWERQCGPLDALTLSFSNPLAEGQDLKALVQVSPEIRGRLVESAGNQLTVSGLKRGQTRYQLTLSSELKDRFGQSISGLQAFAFEVGSLPPALWLGADSLTTVDPIGAPQLDVFTTNYRDFELSVYRVSPADWPDYLAFQSNRRTEADDPPTPPGRRVFQGPVEIDARRDEPVRTSLSLGQWLENGRFGHLLVQIRPGRALADVTMPSWSRPQSMTSWVQVTDLALDAAVDARMLQVWASRLSDGAPLVEADIEIGGQPGRWRSDTEGLARIELPARSAVADQPGWIVVSQDEDSALLPDSNHWLSRSSWHRRDEVDELIWQVFDDRQLYRPGEAVHVKGWVRRMERRPDGGLGLPMQDRALRWEVIDSRGNELLSGETSLSGLGGFDLSFRLPDTPNLGQARLALNLDAGERVGNTRHVHDFRIEEFRRPEFEVRTETAVGPFIGEAPITVGVQAGYYAGGALTAAPLRWQVRAEHGDYRPPGHDEWAFGFQPSWWMPWLPDDGQGSASEIHQGQTDGLGRHALAISLDFSQQARPLAINASATVTDVNRQAWSAATDLLVHPGEAYVGMKTEAYFVELASPMDIDLLTVNLDGTRLRDRPVVVEAKRLDHGWRPLSGQISDDEIHRCETRSDDEGLARCSFEFSVGGAYQLTATTMDEQGRRNASRITRWVAGGRVPGADRVEIEPLMLIPDQDEHVPGELARLLVQAPFENAEGLLTLRRHGLAEQRRFRIEGRSITLEIPIKREWMPNIEAHVTLIGSASRGDDPELPKRPAIAVGRHSLEISTAERALSVAVEPAQMALSPGAETEIELRVLDVHGQPVANAEIALVVVDEAVLALSGYRWLDPLGVFYRERQAEVRDYHLRPSVRLKASEDLAGLESAFDVMVSSPPAMMDGGMMERAMVRTASADEPGSAIDVREDFNPLAAFEPTLVTDADGRARARIRLPDNLTRYRISAIAVADASHYGLGEASLTARLPLMLRPSPPRFLNFGDRFEFPLILQNQTDEALEVTLAMATSNLELTEAQGYALTVPARDRLEVRFPAAAEAAGTARYQLAVAAGDFADAARGELPVWTPATSEAFASYGVIDAGAIAQPVRMPQAVWPQFGQLEVTTSSTAVQALSDAFLYLQSYPFACSEQLASRIIATAALRDVLEAFAVAGMPTGEEIDLTMTADLARLAGLQNPDGGFGLWQRGHESWPYATVHVAHALVRARLKGYPVDQGLYERTLAHVRDIERQIPDHYGDWARRHIVAYSLHVRALAGDHDRSAARALIAEVDDLAALSLESLGWLLGVLSGEDNARRELVALRRFLANRVVETAASANFVSGWRDGAHLVMHSDRRADGVILEALIADQPGSDLIPKLVNGLQAHRVRGRWGNTQENTFVLLALDKYFNTYERETPDFLARAWLGDSLVGEHAFRGRTTARHHVEVPMQWLSEIEGEPSLVLDKDGAGRLYYRIGLRYAPRSLDLAAASHGFEIQRRYLAVDDEDDVRQREDGHWEIRAGARVEVELELVAPTRRYHVALIDPLPAGLEPINPALLVSQPAPLPGQAAPLMGGRGGWWGPWYQHQNLRDERAEAFTALLPGGVYRYSYFARATTPGDFVVPPARAEEMYAPETFGRSASDRLTVFP
jgi:alpha-2-macroglobulin